MLRPLKKQYTIPNFYPIFGGLLLAQLFNLLNLLILPRFFSPEDFALFGIFSSLVFIIIEIVNLKLDIAIQVADETQRKHLTQIAIITAFFISLIVFIFSIVYVLNYQHYYFLFLPLITFAYGINQSMLAWLNIHHKNHLISTYRVLIVIVNFVVSFCCIYFWNLHFGLIFGFISAQSIAALFLLIINRSIFKSIISFDEMKNHFQVFSQFPKFGVLSSLINTITQNGIIPSIVYFFGNTLGGFYTMGSKVIAVPSGLYQTALTQIFMQQAAHLTPTELHKMSRKILYFGFSIGIMPSILILIFGANIFSFLFGEEWQVAGNVASYIVLWYFVGALSNPINFILDIYQKLAIELYWNIASFVLKFSCLWIGFYYQNFWLAIALLTFVSIVMNLILLLFSFRLLKQKRTA
ncbi:MAG TPA: oligosaccharide flippase family protein [Chitinophagales bacterium]|nr:oligosaccharide flippase family protein [Chitinophagales bacterium]